MPEAFTRINLAAVDDAAPGNGFGDRWEARVARDALAAEHTGVTLFRLLPGKRSPFTHRHTDAERSTSFSAAAAESSSATSSVISVRWTPYV
jgi:hypothetical protein